MRGVSQAIDKNEQNWRNTRQIPAFRVNSPFLHFSFFVTSHRKTLFASSNLETLRKRQRRTAKATTRPFGMIR